MATRLTSDQLQRLADAIRAKLLAKSELLSDAEGEITIRVFRKGEGFDIKLTVTTN